MLVAELAESVAEPDDRMTEVHLEYERARTEMVRTGSRMRILLQSGAGASLAELAEAADACSLQAGRLAGLARLLDRLT